MATSQVSRRGSHVWAGIACALALLSAPAFAQVTWDANTGTSGPQDGSGTWSTTDANWWNGTTDVVWPNLTTSSAVIGANSGAAGTITTSGSLTLNAITFNAPGSGTYTLTGGTLGFAGTSPTITANAAATIGSAITSSGFSKAGTGTLTLSGNVSNTSGGISISRGAVTLTGTLTNTASVAMTVGSANGGLLTIAGGSMSTSWSNARSLMIGPGAGNSGTMAISSGALSASGVYIGDDGGGNGVVTQSGGTVSIGSANLWIAGNTSSLTVSGGSFTNNNTTHFAVGSPNPSTSTISVSGSGSITLNTLNWGNFSRNGFTATLNVGDGTGGGTFQVNSIGSAATSVASTLNFNSGTFVANNTFTMPAQISTVVKSGGANISVASARTLTLGSPLTDDGGDGGLVKLGSGTLSLTGVNTYAGTTSIAAGSLSIGNALALQNSTLDLAASDTGTVSAIGQNSTLGGLSGSRNLDMLTRTLSIGNNGASTTYSGTLSNGALTKIGSGTFTLTGANAYTGATVIDAGVLQIGDGGTTGSLSASSAISGSAGAGIVFSRTDNYGGDVVNNIGGGIGLALNSGTLSLTGSNAYAGTTRINGGVLSLGSANALAGVGNVTFAGGTMQFTASNSGDFASRIKDSGSAIAIDTNGQNRTLAGSIDSTNTAGLVKSGGGTLTLSGSNSLSGGVTLTGGALQVGNANALGTGGLTYNVDAATSIIFNLPTSGTVANAITINKPGVNRTYDIYQNQANNITLAGNITIASGNGNVFRLGGGVTSGTFTLTGSNTFGSDVGAGANITFRFGGTNAAGTSVWRPDLSTKMVLLDGANFRGIVGNAVASYSMETAGTATFSADVFTRNTANVLVDLPAGAQLTFAANIRAEGGFTTGTFTKSGAGTWVVNNTVNQMTFNVLEGTLQVPSFGGIGPTSTASFLVLSGGTLRYTGAAASSTREFTLGANGGSLDASGSGSAAFTSTAAVSFTGSGNRTLTLTGTNTGNNTLAMALNDNGADVLSLSKTGAGRWVLSGSNSYTGSTAVSAGSLVAGGTAAFGGPSGNVSVSGGVLDLGGYAFTRTGTVSFTGGTTQSGTITNNTVAFDAQAGTVSAVLAGNAGLTKTGLGKFTFTAAQLYSGNTLISGGTLALSGAGSIAESAFIKAGVAAGDGGVLDVTALGGGLQVASGKKLGGYGTVLGDVTIAGGAIVAPGGSIGSLNNVGTQTWGPGGSYLFEITDAITGVPGTGWDLLTVDALTITATAGQFSIALQTLTNGLDETAGLMDGANWNPNGNYQWKFLVADTTTFSSANFDSAWFTVVESNFLNATNGTFSVAYGGSGAGGLGGSTQSNELYIVYAAVPEPGSLALAVAGLAGVAWAARRRRRCTP